MKKTYADPMLNVKVFTEIRMTELSGGVDGTGAANDALKQNSEYMDTMSLKDSVIISL